jgi:hypothetical protein
MRGVAEMQAEWTFRQDLMRLSRITTCPNRKAWQGIQNTCAYSYRSKTKKIIGEKGWNMTTNMTEQTRIFAFNTRVPPNAVEQWQYLEE